MSWAVLLGIETLPTRGPGRGCIKAPTLDPYRLATTIKEDGDDNEEALTIRSFRFVGLGVGVPYK